MKLGRVRISLSPGLVQPGQPFKQELDLLHGCIRLTGGSPQSPITLTVFVDVDYPTIHVLGASAAPTDVKVTLETWRTERKRLNGKGADAELTSSWTMHDAPDSVEVWESADQVLDSDDSIVWCHRNESSIVPLSIKHQGLESIADSFADPLINRTFGGVIKAAGSKPFHKDSPTTIQSDAPVTKFNISVTTLCTQADSVNAWQSELAGVGRLPTETPTAQQATEDWWNRFWSRSFIFVDGDRGAAGAVPSNVHPITLGRDSTGGNRFSGEITRAGVYRRPLADEQIAALAEERRELAPSFPVERAVSFGAGDKPGAVAPNSAPTQFAEGFTLEARLKPDVGLPAARILDKLTPGRPDGFLFDIQPNSTLRLIVGAQTLTAPNAVKLGEWNHVAATYDPATDRLRLFVDGKPVAASNNLSADDSAVPSLVTRGYVLQRWIQACGWGGGRGVFPIKFNGSIFTVDPKYTVNEKTSPDFRRWGDCYWWQNTRLPYHPMLASGDFEMMDPLFLFYLFMLPACEERARVYHNVSGAYFPETVTLNGLYSNGDYGWNRKGHEPSEILCPWWQYAWNQGPELVSLMLDRHDYTQDADFAREQLVPMATSVLKYFDTRFKRDSNGKLIISPTQSIETYWKDVINDLPCVAGLHDVTTRLLALPNSFGSPEDRELWQRLHDALPPVPTRTEGGCATLLPRRDVRPQAQQLRDPRALQRLPASPRRR